MFFAFLNINRDRQELYAGDETYFQPNHLQLILASYNNVVIYERIKKKKLTSLSKLPKVGQQIGIGVSCLWSEKSGLDVE